MKRMQLIRPTLLNDGVSFEVVVDNEIVAKEFTSLISTFQNYMRTSLRNSKIKMVVRVNEAVGSSRPISRVDKFKMMAEKNEALVQLKKVFDLEFY